MIADDAPGIRLSVGVSGSGKTYGQTQAIMRSARHFPIIVADIMHEWTMGDAGAKSVAQAVDAISRGARLVILRCGDDIEEVSEELCAWATNTGDVAGIAFPEAHHSFPNVKLTGAKINAMLAWRHKRVAMWMDTQRLANLNRSATEQAGDLRLYATVGELDLKRVKEIGGSALVAEIHKCSAKLAEGDRGWHVSLSASRLPPYRAQRVDYKTGGYVNA